MSSILRGSIAECRTCSAECRTCRAETIAECRTCRAETIAEATIRPRADYLVHLNNCKLAVDNSCN
jgi:hypothetical protein